MATAGLETFETTVQETNLWLKSIMRELQIYDAPLAWALLGAALHALRDRLQPESAAHLGAQFPMLIRGLYYDHWPIAATPTKDRRKAAFLEHLASSFPPGTNVDPERVASVVFGVISEHVDRGAVEKTVKLLPKDLRDLWGTD